MPARSEDSTLITTHVNPLTSKDATKSCGPRNRAMFDQHPWTAPILLTEDATRAAPTPPARNIKGGKGNLRLYSVTSLLSEGRSVGDQCKNISRKPEHSDEGRPVLA